ncbi:dTDP-4-dehydrorhamnose 3,5-epimerase family protein [Polymorphospora sp. NPDC051019]|uniref:dTDP-4-dehydrorhamnose 3,5-epimerase family protein n=1 Tax=Polymorphospora sp. NPDC051019 TaxID=3155725 RepID=UPI00343E5384
MTARELAVTGAIAFAPRVFPDERGVFASPYVDSVLTAAVGHPLFPVRQTSYSVSRRGVLRGVHFTATPPGSAKLVSCPRGRVLDMVVDLRAGSPTFGRFDSVVLDAHGFASVYIPVGVGHAFVALEDDSVMSYLLSQEYVPANELAVSPTDPALGLPIPYPDPTMSARDRVAPTLGEARAAGLLPDYDTAQEIEAAFRCS